MKKLLIILTILLVLAGCSRQEEQGWKEIPIDTSSWLQEDNTTNTGGITMPTKVHAEHILVKTNQEANSILFDLNRGANFEEIAKNRSLCPSGKNGGDLGWFGRGMMVKEFEDAAFATQPGKISGIVKTQFGYHIIKVLEAK